MPPMEKLIEIIYGALFSGIISALTVILTFKLGQYDSDRKWRKENHQRKTIEELENQISCLVSVSDSLTDFMMNLNSASGEKFQYRFLSASKVHYAAEFFTKYDEVGIRLTSILKSLQGVEDIKQEEPQWNKELPDFYLTDEISWIRKKINELTKKKLEMYS